LHAEQSAGAIGLLQSLDARVKVAGILSLIVAAVLSHRLWVIVSILAGAVALAMFSRVSLATLASRVWVGALAFTGPIAVPAIFLTPGLAIYRTPAIGWPVTMQGLTTAALLL